MAQNRITYRIHCRVHTVHLEMQEIHSCRCHLASLLTIFLKVKGKAEDDIKLEL